MLLGTVAFLADAFAFPTRAGTKVDLVRVPDGGLQPQAAVAANGTVHLIYLNGEPKACDVFYVRQAPSGPGFSKPLRVNSQPGTAIAVGTIRGAQLALGKDGRVHVAWNSAKGDGMFYARLNDTATAFEPQQNVMTWTKHLDGGGSVAADPQGNVYVMWHAHLDDAKPGEQGRAVVVARSRDEGKTFAKEVEAIKEPTGACGCCGMRAFADSRGAVYALYRAAAKQVNRDMNLLISTDGAQSFRVATLGKWQAAQCPMSSATLTESGRGILAAWELGDRVFYTLIDPRTGEFAEPKPAPASAKCKHPVTVGNALGEVLLVWTEGTGWAKGGAVAWQVFGKDGQPSGETGRADGVPVWGLATAFARRDGGFAIVH
jgi:hypothetical protein